MRSTLLGQLRAFRVGLSANGDKLAVSFVDALPIAKNNQAWLTSAIKDAKPWLLENLNSDRYEDSALCFLLDCLDREIERLDVRDIYALTAVRSGLESMKALAEQGKREQIRSGLTSFFAKWEEAFENRLSGRELANAMYEEIGEHGQ